MRLKGDGVGYTDFYLGLWRSRYLPYSKHYSQGREDLAVKLLWKFAKFVVMRAGELGIYFRKIFLVAVSGWYTFFFWTPRSKKCVSFVWCVVVEKGGATTQCLSESGLAPSINPPNSGWPLPKNS